MTRYSLAEAGVPKYLWQEAFQIVPRQPRWEIKRLSRCGTVEHACDLSTFELLMLERSCMKSGTSRN